MGCHAAAMSILCCMCVAALMKYCVREGVRPGSVSVIFQPGLATQYIQLVSPPCRIIDISLCMSALLQLTRPHASSSTASSLRTLDVALDTGPWSRCVRQPCGIIWPIGSLDRPCIYKHHLRPHA